MSNHMQNKLERFLLLWLCGIFSFTAAQEQQQQQQMNAITLEITKCTAVKQQLFEEVKTFSALIHGAPEMRFTVDNCKQFAPFIVGGSPASPKEFPLIARLGRAEPNQPTKWFCGGTLISEKFVLTAAHCFYSRDGEVNVVRLGEIDFDNPTGSYSSDYNVSRYIEHKDYNQSTVYNDIGLIELSRPVKFDRFKHPACLPTTSGDELNQLLAIGWGSIRFAGPESKQLLKVSLDRYEYERCKRIIDDNDTEKLPRGVDHRSQFCAGSTKARDTCSGDSGGPLLAYHPDYPCLYTVVGVTSFGIGCGSPGQPGIYTRVYEYMDWIKDIVWPKLRFK